MPNNVAYGMANGTQYGTRAAFAAMKKDRHRNSEYSIHERSKREKTQRGSPFALVARTVRASAALQRKLVHYSLCFIYPGEISNGSDLDVKETDSQRSMLAYSRETPGIFSQVDKIHL